MIKVLLALVLVVTTISIAVMDLSTDPVVDTPDVGLAQGAGTGDPENGGENGSGEHSGDVVVPPIVLPTQETPPAQVEATSIDIEWRAKRAGVNDMALRVGDELELWAEIWPSDADAIVTWETDAHTVANFTIHPEDHRRVTLEARGAGQTIIRAAVGEERAEVIVRVR